MENKYLKDYLIEGAQVENLKLYVKSADKGVSNNGNLYFNLVLQDISGSIVAKKWVIEIDDDKIIIPNNVIEVSGTIIKYRNQFQLKVESVLPCTNYDLSDFVISCPLSSENLKNEIYKIIDLVTDADLKNLALACINEYQDRYFTYPAAVSVHHAFKGGIAYHSLCICKDAISLCNLYPQLNEDYLIVGSLLHDIGKTYEMGGIVATSYTLEGNLLGHISLGANMVSEIGRRIKTPQFKLDLVLHMILSHHGEYEYGSPVLPKTQEAYVLHALDDLDSKLYILKEQMKSLKVGETSQRLPTFDNRQFVRTK